MHRIALDVSIFVSYFAVWQLRSYSPANTPITLICSAPQSCRHSTSQPYFTRQSHIRSMAPKRKATVSPASNASDKKLRRSGRDSTEGQRVPYEIRRIIAEKTISRDGEEDEKQYLMDWFPSWQLASSIPEASFEVEVWEKNKPEHTFKFCRDTVYQCSNPTDDDSAETARELTDNVLSKFRNWMIRPAETVADELFKDSDWVFSSSSQEKEAAELARTEGRDPPRAFEVMQRSYVQARDKDPEFGTIDNLTYGDIGIQYLGQVDRRKLNVEPKERKNPSTPRSLLKPLFGINFHRHAMLPRKWRTCEVQHHHMKPLSAMAEKFIRIAPFMLTHHWPHMFTRLFWTSDQVVPKLKEGHGIDVLFGWEDRTRDRFLYCYKKLCKDERPVEHVERTYLKARDACRWHAMYKTPEDDKVMVKEKKEERKRREQDQSQ